MKHAARGISLWLLLACTTVTFGLGVAQKSPCADGRWDGTKQYRLLCYTDIVPLVGTEQLAGNRLPFLDACAPSPNNCDEYPVLTMYLMRVAAWIGGTGFVGFYAANAVLLGVCAALTAFFLWKVVGRRALWFALAPTLLIYGTMNWDLFAVMLATAAIAAYAGREDEWAGGLLGLGAAAKFAPGMLVVPLFFQGLRDRAPDRSVRILWWSVGAWLATNLPFAIVATGAWWEFFRFNATRPADWDSVWYIACSRDVGCPSVKAIGLWSFVAFLAGVALVWWLKHRRHPAFAPWTLGLPILVIFLLVNKVYSPQYSLWLLPWFVFAATDFRLFVAFEIADIAVFLTRFRFFGSLAGEPWGWPEAWLQWAIAARWLVLIAIVVDWIVREMPPLAIRMPRAAVPPKPEPATSDPELWPA